MFKRVNAHELIVGRGRGVVSSSSTASAYWVRPGSARTDQRENRGVSYICTRDSSVRLIHIYRLALPLRREARRVLTPFLLKNPFFYSFSFIRTSTWVGHRHGARPLALSGTNHPSALLCYTISLLFFSSNTRNAASQVAALDSGLSGPARSFPFAWTMMTDHIFFRHIFWGG